MEATTASISERKVASTARYSGSILTLRVSSDNSASYAVLGSAGSCRKYLVAMWNTQGIQNSINFWARCRAAEPFEHFA